MELAQQSPVMAKAWTFIHNANLDDIERERALAYERARISDLIERSEEIRDAQLTERIETARAMLAAGKPRVEILQFSRLTEEELDSLQ